MRSWYVPLLTIGLLLWGTLPSLAADVPPPAPAAAAAAAAAESVATPTAVVSLTGEIDDFSRDQLFKRFDRARALGAKTVILRLNTPGGLVTSALDISRYLKHQNDLYVIAYVDDMAYSAGSMIALACNEIVMEPGSYLGDAAPIAIRPGGGLQTLGATERAKAESPILADFYDSAVKNGHDPLLAQAMVQAGRVVHWVENPETRARRFVGAEDFTKLTGEGWHEVSEPGIPTPLDSADTLLTVSAEQAVKIGLAKGLAPSTTALASQRGLNVVADLAPGAGERVIDWLGGGVARFLLIAVFLISLYVAAHVPGHGLPEVVAMTSLGLLIGVPLLTGYATWWEVVIILAGLALLALELFVIPGFGFVGVLGIVMMVGGLLLTFIGNTGLPGGWRLPSVWEGLAQGLYAITGGALCSLVAGLWLRRFLPRMPYFNRLILSTVSGAPRPAPKGYVAPPDAPPDAWPFVGTIGVALSELKPGGTAEFPYGDDKRTTSVVADGGYVPRGSKLAVLEVKGSRVVVRPL